MKWWQNLRSKRFRGEEHVAQVAAMNALFLFTLMWASVHGGEESRVSLRAISFRLASQPSARAVPGALGQLTWQETVVRSARHDVADVNAQHDFANVTEVGVQLAEGAATTAFKTQRTDSGRFWHGTEAKSGSVANLLISDGGRLVGSVTTAGTIYSIKTLPSGEVLLSARNASAFKDDPDPEDTPGAAPPGRQKMTNVDDGTVIDLLVLYTRAASAYSDRSCTPALHPLSSTLTLSSSRVQCAQMPAIRTRLVRTLWILPPSSRRSRTALS